MSFSSIKTPKSGEIFKARISSGAACEYTCGSCVINMWMYGCRLGDVRVMGTPKSGEISWRRVPQVLPPITHVIAACPTCAFSGCKLGDVRDMSRRRGKGVELNRIVVYSVKWDIRCPSFFSPRKGNQSLWTKNDCKERFLDPPECCHVIDFWWNTWPFAPHFPAVFALIFLVVKSTKWHLIPVILARIVGLLLIVIIMCWWRHSLLLRSISVDLRWIPWTTCPS